MHDPMTVAFDIRWPWWWKDYRPSLITIWHVDPETDGSDDSCGWFIRQRHCDKATLERLVSRYESEWDRVFKSDGGRVYLCGLFAPNGEPRFMQQNLFDILHFAENTTDSLFDGLTRKFEIGCGEKYTPDARQERIERLAGCILAWIARSQRPWYRHPRWHLHHWKVQIHGLQAFKRWAFSRCERCGKRFRWGESPCSNSWNGTGPLWFRSEEHVYHSNCPHEVAKEMFG